MAPTLHSSRPITFLLCLAVTISAAKAQEARLARVRDQFAYWYPQYNSSFSVIRRDNCSAQYEDYLAGDLNIAAPDDYSGASDTTILTQPLIDCMLRHTSDFIKGNMTSAQVLLGVMPTVLAFLSASVDELAMVLTVSRRPVLALLLALGSPSAYFSRAFSYHTVEDILNRHKNRFSHWRPENKWTKTLISVAEYLLVAALAGNVMHCSQEIGVRAVSTIATDSGYLPPVWVTLGAIVQLIGAAVFRLRARGWREKPAVAKLRSENSAEQYEHLQQPARMYKWLRLWKERSKGYLHTEFLPSTSMGFDVRIVTFPESRTFLFMSGMHSTMAVLHIVFGTLVYSSMLFIGTVDALGIVARFFCSTMVCRIIVRYELAGIRESCVSIKNVDELGTMREQMPIASQAV